MLKIDRLCLHLPGEFEHRAASIARLVGVELAGMGVQRNMNLSRLQVDRLVLQGGESDRQVAASVAMAIHQQIGRRSGE